MEPMFLDVNQVAGLLACSTRHVCRLGGKRGIRPVLDRPALAMEMATADDTEDNRPTLRATECKLFIPQTAHPHRNFFECTILHRDGLSRSLGSSLDSRRRCFARTSRSPSPGSSRCFGSIVTPATASKNPRGNYGSTSSIPISSKAAIGDHWLDVMDRLEFGDMPPEEAPALKQEDRELMMAWIAQGRRQSDLAKHQVPIFRRLTRREYERTMQDLLGLPIEFGTRLPEDGKSKDGFRNDGDVLRMSPLQYETYLQIADEALAEAIVSGPPPVVHRYRITVHEFRVEPLPKPADRPGESFDYESHPFDIAIMPPLPPPGGGRGLEASPEPVPAQRPAAVGDRAFPGGGREAAQELRRPPHASGVPQRAKPSSRSVPRASSRKTGADSSRVPILTVAMGSSNFHGVELKTVGEPIVIDHTDLRTYEIRFRMENVSVPNTGPLNNRNSTILAAWNSAQVIDGESQPPLLKIEWIEFESPLFRNLAAEDAYRHPVRQRRAGREGVCPRSPAPFRHACLSWPAGPGRAGSARELLDAGHAKTPIPWKPACGKRSASF